MHCPSWQTIPSSRQLGLYDPIRPCQYPWDATKLYLLESYSHHIISLWEASLVHCPSQRMIQSSLGTWSSRIYAVKILAILSSQYIVPTQAFSPLISISPREASWVHCPSRRTTPSSLVGWGCTTPASPASSSPYRWSRWKGRGGWWEGNPRQPRRRWWGLAPAPSTPGRWKWVKCN